MKQTSGKMGERSDDGWPRSPPSRVPPATGPTTSTAADDGGDASDAAAGDDDDDEEDETRAATNAGVIQAQGSSLRARKTGGDERSSPRAQKRGGGRHPPSRQQGRGGATNRRSPTTTRTRFSPALDMYCHYAAANTSSLRRCLGYYGGTTVGGGAGAYTE